MKKEQINELVATKVMGWYHMTVIEPVVFPFDVYIDQYQNHMCFANEYNPTEHKELALQVAEKMKMSIIPITDELYAWTSPRFLRAIDSDVSNIEDATPLDICLAALEMAGHELTESGRLS